ncbi:hypothetical protein BI335_10640 [Enemella evansiae]|uniref:hypothetical protein n=1 Tax=Enemella evansiae TaxID=2016499 RepID=UPI000B962A86|nr:hypothetical protein [Enemella evansiae]OYO16514.1 hypothetical protein BI335_10640 [Enemella evansiae]
MNRVWRWATWLAELLLVVLAVLVITASDNDVLFALLAWNLVALVMLILGAIQLRRSRDREVDDLPDANRANFRLTGFLWAVIPLLTSLTGMVAAITVVLNEESSNPDAALAAKVIGPLTMILA